MRSVWALEAHPAVTAADLSRRGHREPGPPLGCWGRFFGRDPELRTGHHLPPVLAGRYEAPPPPGSSKDALSKAFLQGTALFLLGQPPGIWRNPLVVPSCFSFPLILRANLPASPCFFLAKLLLSSGSFTKGSKPP